MPAASAQDASAPQRGGGVNLCAAAILAALRSAMGLAEVRAEEFAGLARCPIRQRQQDGRARATATDQENFSRPGPRQHIGPTRFTVWARRQVPVQVEGGQQNDSVQVVGVLEDPAENNPAHQRKPILLVITWGVVARSPLGMSWTLSPLRWRP